MPYLYDRVKKQVVNVDDHLVTDAVNSGNYAFRSGVRIPVIDQQGNVGTILSDETTDAFKNGYRFLTQAEEKQKTRESIGQIKDDAFGGTAGKAAAFTSSALSTASFGLSDVALRAAGQADTIREAREANPLTSLAGDLAGFAVPTGAGAAIAKVGEAASAAVKAGKAAEEVGALTRAGAAAVGGLAEGALIGAQQTVSEAALKDPELTTEKAIANVGLGALFNGALMGTGRLALDGVGKGVTTGLKALSESEAIPKSAAEFAGRLSEIYGKATNMVRGNFDVDPEAVKLWDKGNAQFRKDVVDHISNPQKMYDDVVAKFNPVLDSAQELESTISKATALQRDLTNINFRQVTGIEDKISGKTLEAAEKKAGNTTIKAAKEDAIGILERMANKATSMADENFSLPGSYDPGVIMAMRRVVDTAATDIERAGGIGDIAAAMQRAKSALGDEGNLFPKSFDMLSANERRSVKIGRDFYHELRSHTVNEGLYGALGARIAETNDKLTIAKAALTDFKKLFFDRTKNVVDVAADEGATNATRKGVQDGWERNYSKIQSFIQDVSAGRNEKKLNALEDTKSAMKEIIDSLAPLGELKGPGSKEANEVVRAMNEEIARAQALAKNNISALDRSLEVAESVRAATKWLNARESFTGKSLHGAILGSAVGGFASNELDIDKSTGALIGAAGGALLGNPRAAVRWISTLENLSSALDKRAAYAAERFAALDTSLAEGAAKKVGQTARAGLTSTALQTLDGKRHADPTVAYEQHVRDINEFSTNPMGFIERVHGNIGNGVVSQNPMTTQAAVETSIRAVQFLQSKMPTDPLADGMFPNKYTPSTVELNQYANYVRAVMHPDEIFKELKAGSLNHETVEAVRAVYPGVYARVQQAVVEKLKKPDRVSYDKRVQLGILFDAPTVPSLNPQYLSYLGSLNGQSSETNLRKENAERRSAMVGMRDVAFSDREATDVSQNAMRR